MVKLPYVYWEISSKLILAPFWRLKRDDPSGLVLVKSIVFVKSLLMIDLSPIWVLTSAVMSKFCVSERNRGELCWLTIVRRARSIRQIEM